MNSLGFLVTNRTIIGLLFIAKYIYKHENNIYRDNEKLRIIDNIEKFKTNKKLYIIKNFKDGEVIKICDDKNSINKYIYNKIDSIEINENMNIEYNISLIDTKIDIEWDNELCFLGSDIIIDNINELNNCIENKIHNLYFCFNKKEHNLKYEKHAWHIFVNNSYEDLYFSNIYKIWTEIQNEYQYKNN